MEISRQQFYIEKLEPGILGHAIKRKRAHETLTKSDELFHKIIEKNADGIVVVDSDGIVRFVNPAAESLFGLVTNDLLGKSFGFPVVGDETAEIEIIRRAGKTIIAQMRVAEMDLKGQTFCLVGLRDMTELIDLREELQTRSLMDELTGLYNRRAFLNMAEQQLKIANRTKRGLFVLFADLDGLKGINDTFGHSEGDRALVEAASVLKETFRESDIVGRIGGDEFAIVAIESSGASAKVVSTRLQKNLVARTAKGNPSYKLSLSVGAAYYDPECPCSIEEVMARADKLMYEQKRSKQHS